MKKLFPIVMLLILGFAACTPGEGSKFAGKYSGTFTFVRDNYTKDGTVLITNNPLSTNGILMYACLPLEETTPNVYEANSENVEYMATILESMTGGNNYIDSATEQVKNIKVKATFTDNKLDLTVAYEVQILGIATTEIRIIEFTGTK